MQIGVIFPQTEYGSDPPAILDFAQTAESLGFTHLQAYDHVLGANPNRPGGWTGPYTHESAFLEPFVLFSYMAGFTKNIRFATRILILPQRQTALVAKQAATLDVISGGRLTLGVGLGWNQVEYLALGKDFHTRGRQIEEQVILLRRLFTQPLVSFEGRWHTIPDAGINPLPIQRPIPIWFGGHSEAMLHRAARLGDGWMPNYPGPAEAQSSLDLLARFLAEAGRSSSSFGIEARLAYGNGDPDTWHKLIMAWQVAGATHLTLNTMGIGLKTPGDHLKALRIFAETVSLPSP